MAGQPEEDPLLELRDSLEDSDEPLFAPRPPRPASATATPARGVVPAPRSSAPPPLPPGRKPIPNAGPTGPSPSTLAKTGAFKPAPPGADAHPLPQTVVRPAPGQDPFQEPPEPRLPAGGDPEEKLKTFRTILKQKEETLARGRSLYRAVDEEAISVRAVAEKLKVELHAALLEAARGDAYPEQIQSLKEMLEKDTIRADDAEKRMDALVAQLAEGEAERKDLSQALVEVESQFTETTHRLEGERQTRVALAEELIGAKEALSTAQDRVADLGARTSEAQGALEATTEQLALVSQELETAQLQRETLELEVTEGAQLRTELEAMTARVSDLGEKLAESEGKATALEGEQEWSKSSLDQAQARVTELEEKTADDALKLDALSRQVAALTTEGEAAEAEKSDALGRAADLDGQLNQTRDELQAVSAELEEHRVLVGQHEVDLAKARADSEAAMVKKVRAELNQANQRAMDSGAALRKEKEQREAAQSRISEAEAKREAAEAEVSDLILQLQAAQQHAGNAEARANQSAKAANASSTSDTRLKAVEEQLRATQTMKLVIEKELAALKAARPAAAAQGGASTAELEKLRADLATMKKKMATAESAIEAAASLKSKVARLENQLKGK